MDDTIERDTVELRLASAGGLISIKLRFQAELIDGIWNLTATDDGVRYRGRGEYLTDAALSLLQNRINGDRDIADGN